MEKYQLIIVKKLSLKIKILMLNLNNLTFRNAPLEAECFQEEVREREYCLENHKDLNKVTFYIILNNRIRSFLRNQIQTKLQILQARKIQVNKRHQRSMFNILLNTFALLKKCTDKMLHLCTEVMFKNSLTKLIEMRQIQIILF